MKKWAATPYLIWCVLFILIPLLLVFIFSFIHIEPAKAHGVTFTLDNYRRFMEQFT